MSWDSSTAAWWTSEVTTDPAYARDVDPLLDAVLGPQPQRPVLDLGCGEGRLLTGRLERVVGLDRSLDLLRTASTRRPVCAADLARLPFADASCGAAYAVLVIEHLEDVAPFFAEAARVVAAGGWLALVLNHPLWTAPGSGPFLDPDDGEVLWRWGGYLEQGFSDEPAGDGTVRFHHRPLGDLLSSAAGAGWSLECVVERPMQAGDDPLIALQTEIPRLMAIRWGR